MTAAAMVSRTMKPDDKARSHAVRTTSRGRADPMHRLGSSAVSVDIAINSQAGTMTASSVRSRPNARSPSIAGHSEAGTGSDRLFVEQADLADLDADRFIPLLLRRLEHDLEMLLVPLVVRLQRGDLFGDVEHIGQSVAGVLIGIARFGQTEHRHVAGIDLLAAGLSDQVHPVAARVRQPDDVFDVQ